MRQLLTGTLASTVGVTDTTASISTGGTETFTATISPTVAGGPVPTGTIDFYSYTSAYPSQTADVGSSGTAQIQVTGSTAGFMIFQAVYSGDGNYAPSNSSLGTAVVNAQSIQPTLTKNSFSQPILQGSAGRGSITVQLTNPTGSTISGRQTIAVAAFFDTGSSFTSTTVGQVKANVTLAAGASKSFVVPVNMKGADGTAGTYSLVPSATNKSTQSSYEIAPVAGVSGSVTVDPAFVDLSATLTTLSPKSNQALPGKSVSASLEIFNNGNVAADGTITTIIDASPNQNGTFPIFSDTLLQHVDIAPGKHETFHITKTVPIGSIPKTYYLVADVDTQNSLNESNLANNTAVDPNALIVLDPFPNLIGAYFGTWTVKHGPDKKLVVQRTGAFLAEDDTTGVFDFTGIDNYPDGTIQDVTGTGTITPTGIFKSTLSDNSATMTGRLVKGVIRGTFVLSNGDTGVFSWTLAG
jgi:hypothetical protein